VCLICGGPQCKLGLACNPGRIGLRPDPRSRRPNLACSSELTCTNPKGDYSPDHEDGIIGFPIVSDRMKLVTVGVSGGRHAPAGCCLCAACTAGVRLCGARP
jgi:hypothetical protein